MTTTNNYCEGMVSISNKNLNYYCIFQFVRFETTRNWNTCVHAVTCTVVCSFITLIKRVIYKKYGNMLFVTAVCRVG